MLKTLTEKKSPARSWGLELSWKSLLLLSLFCGTTLLTYWFSSARLFRPGFPLDDAWIHQTYARNLARFGEWSFIPGQPSAGSTSPLWSALLAVGYLLNVSPLLWAYLLGWVSLSGIAVTGYALFRSLQPEHQGWALWAGVFLAFEWHLVWAAGSGMETLLYAWLVLLVLGLLALPDLQSVNRFWLGAGIGLCVWLRPDGITLLAPALLVILFSKGPLRMRSLELTRLLLGFLLLAIPYLLFNWALSGEILPNTFAAKQTEYAIHRSLPLWKRLFDQILLPLTGPGALLAPGFIILMIGSVRKRNWGLLAACAWCLGTLALYALRLPVTYQHGRYVIPVMPVLFLLGLMGMAQSWRWLRATMLRRVFGQAWAISFSMILIIFFVSGARAYSRDVAVIESEMVEAAQWVRENTSRDDLIAAHDIGALGYFGERQLVDLAGLISPDVIPFMRDEIRLAAYMDEKGVDYLVTFPGWYPSLSGQSDFVYRTNGSFSPALGGENMTVYRWGNRR